MRGGTELAMFQTRTRAARINTSKALDDHDGSNSQPYRQEDVIDHGRPTPPFRENGNARLCRYTWGMGNTRGVSGSDRRRVGTVDGSRSRLIQVIGHLHISKGNAAPGTR